MRWDDLNKTNPQQWVIIEAIEAHTENGDRVVEKLQLVEMFGDDSNAALRQYVELHKVHPEKEYYVVHTSRPNLDIKERNWTGVRGVR